MANVWTVMSFEEVVAWSSNLKVQINFGVRKHIWSDDILLFFFFGIDLVKKKKIRALSLKEQKKISLLCYILFSNNTIPPLISPNLCDLINFKPDLMFSKVDSPSPISLS